MRQLRSYRRVADKEHWCDRCCTYIQPGEMYEGRVCIKDSGGIIIWKEHINPGCEFPLDPDGTYGVSRKEVLKEEVPSILLAA